MRLLVQCSRLLLPIVLVALVTGTLGAQTVVKSVEDAYVYMAEPALPHNTEGILRVRAPLPSGSDQTLFRNVYIKFDLSGVTGPIVSAKLRLGIERAVNTVSPPGSVPDRADIYQITDDSWTAATVTWNNAPAKGAFILTQKIPRRSSTLPDTSYTIDVTNYVKAEYAADKIVSFVLTDDSASGTDLRFNSSRSTKVAPATTTPELVITGSSTAVEEGSAPPSEFAVAQNYPNPFNPSTRIRYSLPTAGLVTVSIYNILGSEIRTLVKGEMAPGNHEIVWDARSGNGWELSSGMYFCTVRFGEMSKTVKMMLVR